MHYIRNCYWYDSIGDSIEKNDLERTRRRWLKSHLRLVRGRTEKKMRNALFLAFNQNCATIFTLYRKRHSFCAV